MSAILSPTVSGTAISTSTTLAQDGLTRLIYHNQENQMKTKGFTQGICCMLQGYGAGLEDGNGRRLFECVDVPQMTTSFVYEKHEKVISRFIRLKYMGEEDIFGDSDISILIPHCMSRVSALHRDPVVKVKLNNAWIFLNTEEATDEEFKDVRLAQARFTGGVPVFACVVTRFKSDTIVFTKHSTRSTSSVDQRFAIRSETGCFSGRVSFLMHIQPVDFSTVSRLQSSLTNGRSLISSSNIICIAWGAHKFRKTVIVNLPVPANPVKTKKLGKAEAADSVSEKKKRGEGKKDEKVNKWYLGIYGEDENDSLFLFHFDSSSENWVHLHEVELIEIRKDLISFHMPKPLHRFIVLRCRTDVTSPAAKKLVYLLEEELSLRPVKFILYQSPREHSEVTVHCVSVQKADVLYDELYDKGWRFHGTNGPPTSKRVMLKEGSILDIGFRGNIKFDERFNPTSKRVTQFYNSEMPFHLNFTITEADKHLQKNYDSYKGVCMIQLIDKVSFIAADANQSSGSQRSSAGSVALQITAKKASSYINPDRKRVLAELMLQLAKGVDNGQQTPYPGKLSLALDPATAEAIEIVAPKLGKEWEVLAQNLGLCKGRVEALKTRNKQHPDNIKLDMLYTWIKRQPRAADQLPKLYHALMHCGRIDLAYKVEDLYCGNEEPLAINVEVTHAADDATIDSFNVNNNSNVVLSASSLLSTSHILQLTASLHAHTEGIADGNDVNIVW